MENWEVNLTIGEKISGKQLFLLLERIDETGSINKAVEAAGMSYRSGWNLLNNAEKLLDKKLINRQSGGSTGGGSSLTEEGKKLLGYLQSLQREVQGQLKSLISENGPEQTGRLMLASTTEPIVTGLLDVLEQAFFMETGISVFHISAGSGQALDMAKAGRADVVLTHAPKLEDRFLAEGWGVFKQPVMSNEYVLVGPDQDPASVKNAKDIIEAFRRIADTISKFVTRGDCSGTNLAEMEFWTKADIDVSDKSWYIRAKGILGNFGSLQKASEISAYTLVDKASYITGYKGNKLKILMCDDPQMINVFSVIPLSRNKVPTNQEDAEKFSKWLVEQKAQSLIRDFGKQQYGNPLFRPLGRS
ncbi:substrate-binding domain-containing protein [Alkalibacter mobilis]|uniref:substrate-binding domain-containing protein n=1 Tax=Alkalibacter mobilis TaxID=2787712 RepID=UPI00189E14F4|nr:substrate-binding domain-containing protein [Alkalibacter mobilis]MBF7095567.1 substrate-binding domain-containing protein [Alkalibacter mobilis]